MPKAQTIRDIAAKAGVAVCTVSRVLNNSDLVSKKTRKKVEKAIAECNYIPNEMARSLQRQKSKTIALIIPDLSNPFYAELFFGVEEVMSSEGYYIFVCNTKYLEENEHRYIKEMLAKGIDGLIFMSLYYCGDEIFDLVRKNVASVAVQTYVKDMDLILTDTSRVVTEACNHLFELGHTKIAFICLDRAITADRLNAYISAHQAAGIAVREEYIIDGYTADTLGYMAVEKLLSLPEPPSAIQCINDYTAMGVYSALLELGLKIPEDISVIGYDDIKIAKILNPPLTTISQPILEMGRTAGEMLLQQIKRDQIAREVHLPSRLIIRDSTSVPR